MGVSATFSRPQVVRGRGCDIDRVFSLPGVPNQAIYLASRSAIALRRVDECSY